MLNQIRMLLRLAAAHGQESAPAARSSSCPSCAGLGMREVARQAVGFIPVLGWAIQGGIALAGTRALGEAAIVYFESSGARAARGAARDAVRSRS